jgi:outer membrane lipoprotein carrier protein
MDSGKFWRRRPRTPTSCFFLLALAASLGASAQPAQDGIATLEAFLNGVESLQADFKQELWTGDQRLLQTDTGALLLKRPNRFRWTYDEPADADTGDDDAAKLVVAADGTRLWIYDVELEEVTVTPFDDTVGTSPAMLLSGDRNVRDEFDVVDAYPADGLDWVKLEPTGSSDFSSVLIGFRGTEPRRLELVDGLGQVTRIELENIVANEPIDDGVFALDVPDHVNIIGDEG